jgi:hypothetical protein
MKRTGIGSSPSLGARCDCAAVNRARVGTSGVELIDSDDIDGANVGIRGQKSSPQPWRVLAGSHHRGVQGQQLPRAAQLVESMTAASKPSKSSEHGRRPAGGRRSPRTGPLPRRGRRPPGPHTRAAVPSPPRIPRRGDRSAKRDPVLTRSRSPRSLIVQIPISKQLGP